MRLAPTIPVRRGTVLVLFALIVFGLLALAAVVIDVGVARLNQRAMQSAADTAALEVLRFRDEKSEEDRRSTAASTASLVFKDSTARELTVQGGVGDLDALGTIIEGAIFDPTARLQPNLGDAVHGDMVAGTYKDNPSNPDYPAAPRDENSAYQRRDFVPLAKGDAFLVRLRRTNDPQGLDRVSGVSSSSPTVPFLFGRGTMIQAGPSRKDGITVRATAIADARPVLSAGIIDTTLSLPGVAPFALNRASWNTWRTANPMTKTLSLTVTGTSITGAVTGFFIAAPMDAVTIGQPLQAAVPPTLDALHRYVPLVETVGGTDRVAGFLHVTGGSASAGNLTFTISTAIAAQNATTAVAHPLPTDLTADQVNQLFAFSADIRDPLRAPALVNRYLGPPP